MDTKRRNFLKIAGAGITAATVNVAPTLSGVAGTANAAGITKTVVVIGGGFGGATVAKYLRLWGQGNVNVIWVNAKSTYVSPILSNLVLNGKTTTQNLTFNLANAASKNGITFIEGTAVLDRGNRSVNVTLPNGTTQSIGYDKVVVSPGVDFDHLPSTVTVNSGKTDLTLPVPHAWQAGDQINNLKAQIAAMPARGAGRFVICIPKKPYRCPPGPYERACVVADILKRTKGGGKVYVFDANTPDPATPNDPYSAIQAEAHTFKTAFTGAYAGIVQYASNAELLSVAVVAGQYPKSATVKLSNGTVITQSCNVLNVIPRHQPGSILKNAGLIPAPTLVKPNPFAPVHLDTYASTIDPDIYIIGDSHESTQPKAGHIANSEAKVCADAIARDFGILPPRMADEVPVTNSACYSPISQDQASWLTVGFRYNPATQTMDRSDASLGEAASPSIDNYNTMISWANNLFADTFTV